MIKAIAKVAVVAAAVGGLQLGVIAPAEAQFGFLCGFTSVTDPTVEGDVQTGEIDGGPLFVEPPDPPESDIQLICTIQVGAQGATHAGADAARAESLDQNGSEDPTYGTPGVAVIPPTQISYVAPEGTPVYLCTQAVVNGQNRYFNETGDPLDPDRGWQLTSSASCALAISQEVSVPECSDGVDNDGDGQIDFPDDPQCTSPDDDSELT